LRPPTVRCLGECPTALSIPCYAANLVSSPSWADFEENPSQAITRNTIHREADMQKSGSFIWQGYARFGLAAPLVLTMSIMSVSSSLSAEAIQSRLSTSTVKAWQKLAQTPLRSQCIERFSSCRAYCSSRPHDRRSREVCRKTCRDELTQCKRTRGA